MSDVNRILRIKAEHVSIVPAGKSMTYVIVNPLEKPSARQLDCFDYIEVEDHFGRPFSREGKVVVLRYTTMSYENSKIHTVIQIVFGIVGG